MVVYNPANEGQNYCHGANGATWYINNNSLISFNQNDLVNGTKFNKEIINGLPQKIIWDGGGIGREHIINNPTNYSWSIVQNVVCKPYRGEITFTGRQLHNGSCTTGIFQNYQSTSTIFNNANFFKPFIESVQITQSGTFCVPPRTFARWQFIVYYRFYNSSCTSVSTLRNTIFNPFNEGTTNPPSYQIRLIPLDGVDLYNIRINDGGVSTEYPINNTTSVQVIFSNGGFKYTFIAGSQSLNQQYQSEQVISLRCGKDCPPETCVKCRDGDYVCCYGENGQVIEKIHDPNNEINGVC